MVKKIMPLNDEFKIVMAALVGAMISHAYIEAKSLNLLTRSLSLAVTLILFMIAIRLISIYWVWIGKKLK